MTKIEAVQFIDANLPSAISFCVVIAMMAVIVLALMHGMVSEVELRELKADRMTYNTILTDRALLERQVAREWSPVLRSDSVGGR